MSVRDVPLFWLYEWKAAESTASLLVSHQAIRLLADRYLFILLLMYIISILEQTCLLSKQMRENSIESFGNIQKAAQN